MSIRMWFAGQSGMVTDAHGCELRGGKRGRERCRRKDTGGYEKQQGEKIYRRMMKLLQDDEKITGG